MDLKTNMVVSAFAEEGQGINLFKLGYYMYKKLTQYKSASPAPLVLVQGRSSNLERSSVEFRSANSRLIKIAHLVFGAAFDAVLSVGAWVITARIVRQVAPGRQFQERHEFEAIELKRGGFGGPF